MSFPLPVGHVGVPSAYDSNYPHNILTVLLGDFWSDRSVPVPSALIVRLLAEFGFSEGSARQTVRRLTERGHLERVKSGRQTSYLPAPSRTADAERHASIMAFARGRQEWDRKWTIVSFTVPEQVRDSRRQLRLGLRKLGFRALNDALWMTPRDAVEPAQRLLDNLSIDAAYVIHGELMERAGTRDALSSTFDLEDLRLRYAEFIDRYEARMGDIEGARMSPADALVHRTRLMADWLAFRFVDPVLPDVLLPDDWPLARARTVFASSYDGLASTALLRFRQLADELGNHDLPINALHSSDFRL